MIDYSWLYEDYVNINSLSHMERFHICLFLVYCQTRNIPIHSFKEGYMEYKQVAEPEDLCGVEDFLLFFQNDTFHYGLCIHS